MTGYGPRGWNSYPDRGKILYAVQTGCGAHPASYPIGTGGLYPGGKAAGASR
jgi:hypothetical protein